MIIHFKSFYWCKSEVSMLFIHIFQPIFMLLELK